MEYIKCFLHHPSNSQSHSLTQRRASQPSRRASQPSTHCPPKASSKCTPVQSPSLPATTPERASPETQSADHHRKRKRKRKHKHKHRRHNHGMSFTGPYARDLAALKKSLSSIPSDNKTTFTSTSNDTLDVFCDTEALHVWETDSDIDSLLQLTSMLAKLCDAGVREPKDMVKGTEAGMVIIAEGDRSKGHFKRLCELVEHLTGESGSPHLEGTVRAYANATIVVVRGWNYRPNSNGSNNPDVERVVKRVSTAMSRALSASKMRKIVWHHGPIVAPLLSFINTTTSSLRNALAGISITDSLHLVSGVKPSAAGRSNTLPDLERLQSYARRLGIPVLFLDSSTQSITSPYLAAYMYFFAYYIGTFLPSSLTRPHLHAAQDELVTFAFRLRGASEKRYGEDVVSVVKKHLDPRSKIWARRCIDPRSYEKSKCQAAGAESSVHHAVQIADAPFALFKTFFSTSTETEGVVAFARLSVGPASPVPAVKQVFTAAPVDVAYRTSRLRIHRPSTLHVLLPKPEITAENTQNLVQGLMMAVLERVRQEHGNPSFSSNEKQMWKDVVKACSWALNGCDGKMPDKLAEKVKFVKAKLTRGTWGYIVGAPNEEAQAVPAGDGSGAASANAAAHAAYSGAAAGLQNAYQQGYGQQMPYAGHGHGQQGMMNLPIPQQGNYYHQQLPAHAQGQQQGAQMAVDPAIYHQGQASGYAPAQGHGYGHGAPPHDHGHAQQMLGGFPATPQAEYAQMGRQHW